jgi:hypothetical protein
MLIGSNAIAVAPIANGGDAAVFVDVPAQWTATAYRFVMTGSNDGVSDTTIPITSFQIRYSEATSYLSAIIKGADAYVSEIEARSNGHLQIYRDYHYSDGTIVSALQIDVPYKDIMTQQGGMAGTTATITGQAAYSPSQAKTSDISDISYRSYAGGKRRLRCAIDPQVRVGDTVQTPTDSFVIGEVIFIISADTGIMELVES